jgi:hypothetical protein
MGEVNKPTEFEQFLSGLYNSLEMSVKVHLYSSLQSYNKRLG